ncbi:serine-rich adhesin for platelets-like [Eurosta solidaginis]|uniref:serine-rich adhesin for platelets-like n=1 Tax=Eurosta solidaginis TaxID=178769 RepID=UPI0035305B47
MSVDLNIFSEYPITLPDGGNTNVKPAARSTITTTTTVTTTSTTTTTTTISYTTNANMTSTIAATNIIAVAGQTIDGSNKCNITTKSTIAFAETNMRTKPQTIHTNSLSSSTIAGGNAIVGQQLTPPTQTYDMTDAQGTATVTRNVSEYEDNNNNSNVCALAATSTMSSTLKITRKAPLTTLKPILKCSDNNITTKTNTMTTTSHEQQAIMSPVQCAKLQLNMAAAASALKDNNSSREHVLADMPEEVPILPKKPAPKSPQITTYTPVYTTKTLTPSPSKTYENVQIIDSNTVEAKFDDASFAEQEQTGVADEQETAIIIDNDDNSKEQLDTDTSKFRTESADGTVALLDRTINPQDTPMLANLRAYQRAQAVNLYMEKKVLSNKMEMNELTEVQETNVAEIAVSNNPKDNFSLSEEAHTDRSVQPNMQSSNFDTELNGKQDTSTKADIDEDDETAGEEYTDDDLDEALAEEDNNETTTESSAVHAITNNKLISAIIPEATKELKKTEPTLDSTTKAEEPRTPVLPVLSFDESHYLPMTPKKSDLAQGTNLTLISMHESTNHEEENPYVEMCKNLADEDTKSNYEIMSIDPHFGLTLTTSIANKTKQLQIQTEPVYMELNAASNVIAATSKASDSTHAPTTTTTHKSADDPPPSTAGKSTLKKTKKLTETLKKKTKKSSNERAQCKRKDLPDILKQSQSTMLAHVSDSSDADDESTKHSELKKMRSRTRFSLSDTFRPASYYLGASTPLADCGESSDSEIVAPPPIPASPPSIEVLQIEEIFSADNYDTVKRRDSSAHGSATKINISYEQLPKLHASNTSLNRQQKPEGALKSSRLSLPDQFLKHRHSGTFKQATANAILKQHERTLSDSNYSFQTDNSSNTSSDFDFYNKLKQNSPSYVATPVRYHSNSSLPQKFILNTTTPSTTTTTGGDSSETDSAVEFRHRQGSDSELDRQRSRRPLSEESISEIESLHEKFEETLSHDLDTYLSHLQSNDLYLYQNTVLDAAARVGSTDLLTKLIKPPETFRNKDDEHFYGNIRFVSSTDSLQRLSVDSREHAAAGAGCPTPTSSMPDHLKYYTPIHSRNNSNISDKSAPYYYAELHSSRELLSTPTAVPLNNQRDVHAHGSNIAHIHNPIEANALTNINVGLLADKDQAIDSKNLYKMKTNNEKLSYRAGKILNASELNATGGGSLISSTSEACSYVNQRLKHFHAPTKLSNFQQPNLHHTHTELTPSIRISPAINTTPSTTSSTQTHNPYTAYGTGVGAECSNAKITNMQMQQLSHANNVGNSKNCLQAAPASHVVVQNCASH